MPQPWKPKPKKSITSTVKKRWAQSKDPKEYVRTLKITSGIDTFDQMEKYLLEKRRHMN